MGRNISTDAVSTLNTAIANVPISAGDLVSASEYGGVYPSRLSYYAATAGTSTLANAISVGSGSNISAPCINKMVTTAGSLYTAVTQSAGAGLAIQRYNLQVAGVSKSAIIVDGAVEATLPNNVALLLLSNGNIAITFHVGASALRYAVIDPGLNIVKAATVVDASFQRGALTYGACSIPGGGFAVCFQPSATPTTQRFATFDNFGVAVTAATTIQTWAGTAGDVSSVMRPLSNGNLAIACSSRFTTTIGLYHGIFSTTGTPVVALTNIDTAAATTVDMAESSTGYCVIRDTKAFVFNNSGAQQGATKTLTGAVATGNPNFTQRVCSDGTFFYIAYFVSASSAQTVRLSSSGSASQGPTFSPGDGSSLAAGCDASTKVFAVAGVLGATNSLLVYLSTENWGANDVSTVSYADATAVSTACVSILLSEGVALSSWTSNIQRVAASKVANTAIQGVATTSVSAGGSVRVKSSAGVYSVNSLSGTLGVNGTGAQTFSHKAGGLVYGNDGSLLLNSVVLKGL